MPEGPSLVILRERLQPFVGKVVRGASGNARLDLARMQRRRILAICTWGKHLLIRFSGFSLRIHLLMFGSYRIDERKDGASPRVHLAFATGEINFYTCSAQFVEGDPSDTYDWRVDVMADAWSPRLARKTLLASPERQVGDVLLDQAVFSGVGNIIRNEVLFRVRVHPESHLGALPKKELSALIREARHYSFQFLDWKKAGVLKRNFQVHTRTICPACGGALKKIYPGTSKRRSFFCPRCQPLYR